MYKHMLSLFYERGIMFVTKLGNDRQQIRLSEEGRDEGSSFARTYTRIVFLSNRQSFHGLRQEIGILANQSFYGF